ncbi:hypothetical protein OAG71_03890 [bacterium]|nr:hypothetical protein [bacterium]
MDDTLVEEDYSTLKHEHIVQTINRLEGRIGERFPESGLVKVCGQLGVVADRMVERADWISRPILWLRLLAWGFCLAVVLLTLYMLLAIGVTSEDLNIADAEGNRFTAVVTFTEAAINDVLLIGAAVFFIFTIEKRYKRSRALKALHELRSIAHIIDMHQLTKDPHRIIAKPLFTGEGLSPKLNMTAFQLRRYLDYCSEMLSLTGKIAAVYVQQFDDAVAMASASELEALTGALSNKVWQKILILESYDPQSISQPPAKPPLYSGD